MAHFDQDFIDFFRELAKNNNREWFNENKKRYEKSVKKPFAAFVAEMIGRIQQKDREVQVQPKDCILRINRDIRFSKDKTPYNLHLTAIISPAGRRDKSIPGFFFRFGAEQIDIMGGCYGPSKEQLAALRGAIAENGAAFRKVIGARAFVSKFGEIRGDEHKRLPKEWQAAAKEQPLIAKKQFYFVGTLDSKAIVAEDLAAQMMTYWEAGRPVNQFLARSLTKSV